MTQAQFSVLTLIAAHWGLPSAELERLSPLGGGTVRAAVAGLERAGLVVAYPQLAVTRAGRRALAREREPALEADLAAGLSAADERAIRRWLVQVED